jgi:UDP-N-acetyl-D-glucosamine dehydrogenase
MLESKIKDKSAKICVVGLGYVGLPLAMEFAKKHFSVYGYDISKEKTDRIKRGEYYADDAQLRKSLKKFMGENISFSSDPSILKDFDVAIICVPTPIDETLNPDMSYVISALEIVSDFLGKDKMVVLESTTFPTTLEHVAKPLLEKKTGLTAGSDFYLVSSPERIDPGNKVFTMDKIPKLVGGVDDKSTKLAALLYSNIVTKVIEVYSPRIAEAAKLLENTFRLVNISLVNEMAKIFEKMDIDTFEVINATATKPFGFMPFYPSAGAGGHCVPVDPFYLSYIAKKYRTYSDFIETAGKINESMPEHIVDLIKLGLNSFSKPLKGTKIGILGLSYKANIGDPRNAASIEIIKILKRFGSILYGFDPYLEDFELIERKSFDEIFECDCVVMVTKHDFFAERKEGIYSFLKKNKAIFIDCVNFFEGIPTDIKYIGLGKPQQIK